MNKFKLVSQYWSECDAVEQTSEKVSGTLVFKGTRVPVSALFNNMGSMDVAEFMSHFPVSENQIQSVLSHMSKILDETALILEEPVA